MSVDAVVTHHTDGFRSGVARFNELLAARLDVPLIGLPGAGRSRTPLLSFKVSELEREDVACVEALLDRGPPWQVFLHEFRDTPLERRLVTAAASVFAGNAEIEQAVRGLNGAVELVWTPGLLTDDRPLPDVELSVFSFGMAHKIRTDLCQRLRDLLEASGKTYAVYLSAANHETTEMRDAHLIFDELHEIFPSTLWFLGNLSDVGVYNYLRSSTFFATFFLGGVRANNGSVAAAMEKGAVVITNLDEHSPKGLVHMTNVIDINRCERLPAAADAEKIGRAAREIAHADYGWDQLVAQLRPVVEA